RHVCALPNCPVTEHLLDDEVAVAANDDALARQSIVEEIFESSDERGIFGHVVGCLAAIRWCVHGRTLVECLAILHDDYAITCRAAGVDRLARAIEPSFDHGSASS